VTVINGIEITKAAQGWSVDENPVLSLVSNNTAAAIDCKQTLAITGVNGHKVYCGLEMRVLGSGCLSLAPCLENGSTSESLAFATITSPAAATWYSINGVITLGATWDGVSLTLLAEHTYTDIAGGTNKEARIRKMIAIDLTAAFGTGSEPTAEEMAELITLWKGGYFEGETNFKQYPNPADWAEVRNLI